MSMHPLHHEVILVHACVQADVSLGVTPQYSDGKQNYRKALFFGITSHFFR